MNLSYRGRDYRLEKMTLRELVPAFFMHVSIQVDIMLAAPMKADINEQEAIDQGIFRRKCKKR